jgi:hypothetical protein
MRNLKHIIPVLPFFLMIQSNAQQEDCAFKLREAQQLFDAGRIENVPGMLQPCIEKGFTQEERLSAFKLIILCQIYGDNQQKAHEGMLAFLKRYPEYELSPTDPDEFRFIFEQYRTRPILDLGAFAGVNRNHGTISQPFSPFNLNKLKPRYISDGFAFQAGVLINFYTTARIQISLDPMYAQANFQLKYESSNIEGFGGLDHFERQSYLYVPLSGTYEFVVEKFRPYLRIGGQLGILFDNKTSTTSGIFTGPDEDNMENRNQLNYWVFGGGGLKYKLNKGFLFVDLRYNVGLNKYLVSSDQRFTQENHNWVYMYQDSDFRLNSFMISAGYARSFYNPKRIQ